MPRARWMAVPMLVALAAGLLLAAGCKSSPQPGEPPPAAPAPAAQPAPAPPVPAARPKDGRIADEEILKKLVQGRTTKDEVREMFGIPQEVIYSPAAETYVYYRERASGLISRKTERVESLTVRFDLGGRLKDFEYRFSGN